MRIKAMPSKGSLYLESLSSAICYDRHCSAVSFNTTMLLFVIFNDKIKNWTHGQWLVPCVAIPTITDFSIPFYSSNIPLCFTIFPLASGQHMLQHSFVRQPDCYSRSGYVSMGKKPGPLPLLGLASQLSQGDSDPCLSGGFLYRICSVIKPLKIPTDGDMVRGKGMVMRDGTAVRV